MATSSSSKPVRRAPQTVKTASTGRGSQKRTRKPSSRPKSPKRKKVRKVKVGAWTAGAIAAAVIAGIFLFSHRWVSGESEHGDKVPPGAWRYGIDVSHNNEGRIVWDSLFVMTDSKRRTVKDPYLAKEIHPVSFVFIKATEGVSMKDRNFAEDWKAAGRTDLKRGAYHFFRSSKDGSEQARNYIATVGNLRHSDFPPVLDIETIHAGCSRKLLNERALQWIKTIEEHYGRKPIIYTGASFAKDKLSKEITDNYPLWIAHYRKASPDWENWTWWQFTDRALVKGVPGPVDLSVTRVKSK
jgi:Lyzozyme M1 (1,4-beta-N-acetylmuramidase)